MQKKFLFSLILVSVSISSALGWYFMRDTTIIGDRTKLTFVPIRALEKPRTIEELRDIVVSAECPVSVAGARFSQGGQIAYPNGIVIDMSYLNRIVAFDEKAKRITVQTGATWHSIQEFIDTNDLSVKVMQSYNDFSIGGSLSVNVHARDMRYGSLLSTVEAITILLADGRLVTADRTTNTDLFNAAIGGYGLLGIIVDVTLSLTDNDRLQRQVQLIDADEYPKTFERLKSDPSIVFQNADIFPMKFDQALSVTWSKTEKPVTIDQRIQSGYLKYIPRRILEVIVRRLPFLKKTRPFFDTIKSAQKMIVWRNYEMSYHTKQLALATQYPTTMTLQEYFVPQKYYREALEVLTEVLNKYQVNVMNLSVRYVPKDSEAVLSYAPQDSYSFVLYINILNTPDSKEFVCKWTQELIDKLKPLQGTFYLPYIICARKDQFKSSYPGYSAFMEIKKKYDPDTKFRNMLWKIYFEEAQAT